LQILDGMEIPSTDEVIAALSSPVALGVGGAVVGAGLGAAIVAGSSRKKRKSSVRKSRSRTKHTSRGWKQDRARRSKQKWELAYQKRKKKNRNSSRKRSSKGVHYTKKGQPYIIMSNGRARFVKKRKGGKN